MPVVRHAQALLQTRNVDAVTGDIADPAAVLAQPEVRALIRLNEPVAVILASVLHFFDAETVKRMIAGYMEPAVPGGLPSQILCAAGPKGTGPL